MGHGATGHAGARNTRPGAAQPDSAEAAGAGSGLLFLREEQMRLAQDLFFFAYRDFNAAADRVLEEMALGRAHHRVLHFVGSRPDITVGDLLALLGITKQSLGRVLTDLVTRGLVEQVAGRVDRRQRLLRLTGSGQLLERQLFERQRERLVAAYREAGGPAVEGFRRVMRGMMEPQTRVLLDRRSRRGDDPDPVQGERGAGPAGRGVR